MVYIHVRCRLLELDVHHGTSSIFQVLNDGLFDTDGNTDFSLYHRAVFHARVSIDVALGIQGVIIIEHLLGRQTKGFVKILFLHAITGGPDRDSLVVGSPSLSPSSLRSTSNLRSRLGSVADQHLAVLVAHHLHDPPRSSSSTSLPLPSHVASANCWIANRDTVH